MGKEEKKADPALTLKPESELTDFERKQLALLQVGEGHDFNVIVERTMAFCHSPEWKERRREKVKSARDKKQSYEILWEQRPSSASAKTAAKFTVNIPNAKAGSVVRLLCDDWQRQDPKGANMYTYDTMLESNVVDCSYGRNVQLNHTTHKAPFIGVGPREMHCYLSYVNSFTPEQQEKLGITPQKKVGGASDAATAAPLHVVAQCMIDFWQFNKEHGITEEAQPQAAEVKKKHVLGSLFYYLLMGQEERDGSLTVTMVIDTDPAGSVPTKFVDMALSEQLNKMKLIVQLCEKEATVEDCLKPYENTRDHFPL